MFLSPVRDQLFFVILYVKVILHYLKSIFFSYRITGDPQKVEYAKQLVYELIAEKEMQMFHRGGRSTDRTGNYSNDSSFNHGPASSDGVEVS